MHPCRTEKYDIISGRKLTYGWLEWFGHCILGVIKLLHVGIILHLVAPSCWAKSGAVCGIPKLLLTYLEISRGQVEFDWWQRQPITLSNTYFLLHKPNFYCKFLTVGLIATIVFDLNVQIQRDIRSVHFVAFVVWAVELFINLGSQPTVLFSILQLEQSWMFYLQGLQ